MHSGLGDEVAVEFVALVATIEGAFGFVLVDFTRQRGSFAAADVRRIAHDKVQANWFTAGFRNCRRKQVEQVGFHAVNAFEESVVGNVTARDFKGGGGNVGGVDLRAGEGFGQADGDAAGACADIGDLETFASCRLWSARTDFTKGQAIEGHLDDVLGFRAGNQHVGGYFQFEAPKFLFSG